MKRRLTHGWNPDLPDHRDHLFAAAPPHGGLPPVTNLHSFVSTVYDQGQIGSCTANAIGQAIMMSLARQNAAPLIPSRLFVYYNERVMEHTVLSDAGAQIRDGIKSVAKTGVCPESDWPYVETHFATRPAALCYQEAPSHLVESYARVQQSARQFQSCLAAGIPIVFGISVFDSFESDEVAGSGNVPMPAHKEKNVGGHAIIGIGLNLGADIHLAKGDVWPARTLLVQNSWGAEWGLKTYPGCFTLPLEYATDANLADDFWAIKLVEG